MNEALTQIQERVIEAVRRRVDLGEAAPTYRDLCEEFGWASTGTARDHLRALSRKGYIEMSRGHRGVRLRDERPAIARVPFVGRVVAGVPVTSEENVEKFMAVPAEWVRSGVYFALRVVGDSMKNAGIFDGDEVIVRKQAVAQDGEIVVATLEGETTLKRLRLRGSRAMLTAENPRYRPIRVQGESAIIQGVVVGLMRTYRGPAPASRRRAARAPRAASPAGRNSHAHRK